MIAEEKAPGISHEFEIGYFPKKTPEYEEDMFFSAMNSQFASIVMIIFITPFAKTLTMALKEKESRIKESMMMMGMKLSSYHFSWIVYYAC